MPNVTAGRLEREMPSSYHCIICKGSMPVDGPQAHRLDPCGLVVVGNANRDWREQREQAYWCHFECFRRVIQSDGLLFIADADFSTNGEIADESAAEAAVNQKHADPGTT